MRWGSVRRRDVIAALGAAVLLWPDGALAQQRAMPVVGIFFDGTQASLAVNLPMFRAGLSDSGFVEGQNVALEFRFADGQYDRLPALAADLVRRKVDVIFAPGFTAPAAKAATSAIPIVFNMGADPVKLGIVASLNRPGGNITGVYTLFNAMTAKQLDLLHRLIPNAERVGFLVNPDNVQTGLMTNNAQAAAAKLGLTLEVVNARTASDFDPAFATLAARHVGALLVAADPFIDSDPPRIANLSRRAGIPVMSFDRYVVDAGGLASYGASIAVSARLAAGYVGRVLKGAKPADLPVVQSEKFDLVLNLKTAKALGLDIPPTILAIADEVIE